MMKKIHGILVGLFCICILSLCSCGILLKTGSLQDMGTSENYVKDTAIYGNSYSNIHNDGAAYIDENGRVSYFCKSEEKAYVGNISDETAVEIGNVELYYINVVDDTLYAYVRCSDEGYFMNWYGYFGSGLMKYDLTTSQEDLNRESINIIREGVILDLQVVDGICYFTDAEKDCFCKYDLASGEETVLIDGPYDETMIYQNSLFFTKEDGKGLYKFSLDSGEVVKLTNSNAKNLIAYEDKILYSSEIFGIEYLKAIRLDGEKDTVLKQWSARETVLDGHYLYFVMPDDSAELGYVDLQDEELTIHSLDLKKQIQSKLEGFAGEQIAGIVGNYGVELEIKDTECMHLSVMNGYLLFDGGYVMSVEPYRCMYAYCLETGELTLLNQQFHAPLEWECILWETSQKEKNVTIEHWIEQEQEFQEEICSLIKTKDILVKYFTVDEIDLGQAIIDEIVHPEMAEVQKFKAIYDYIMHTVKYDYEALENHTEGSVLDQQPIGALKSGLAVCGGYAHTLELLCVLADIDCIYITGFAGTGGQGGLHAWNKVKIDGQWYNVDVTWDDSEYGQYTYDYFLVSDQKFYINHEPYPSFMYLVPESPVSY